jgi:hypothetical protein
MPAGITFRREVFASRADDVVVVQLSASRPASICAVSSPALTPESSHRERAVSCPGQQLTARLIKESGSSRICGGREGSIERDQHHSNQRADTVTPVLAAATITTKPILRGH